MVGTKDRWELIIKDNGSGISEERIAEIKDKIDKALNERQVGNIGGLGIVNTIVRPVSYTHLDVYKRQKEGRVSKIFADATGVTQEQILEAAMNM